MAYETLEREEEEVGVHGQWAAEGLSARARRGYGLLYSAMAPSAQSQTEPGRFWTPEGSK